MHAVAVNQTVFIPYQREPNIKSIGIRGLSACSVVVVASAEAAIVTHVGPDAALPPGHPHAEKPRSYIINTESKMLELSNYYHDYKD